MATKVRFRPAQGKSQGGVQALLCRFFNDLRHLVQVQVG